MNTKSNGIDRSRAIFCSSFIRDAAKEILRSGDVADRFIASRFRQNHRIGSRDRRFLSDMLFAWFRYLGWLKKAGLDENFDLSCAIVSLMEGVMNGPVLSSIENSGQDRDRAARSLQIADRAERFAYLSGTEVSRRELLPEWSLELLPSSVRDSDDFLEMFESRPPMWLRAQCDSIAALQADLMKDGFSSERHERIPEALKIADARGSLYSSKAFSEGKFEIQDFSSQCIGLACMAKPGGHWWDCCAGGGGKTLQLASVMKRKGSVYATDIRKYKLDDLKHRAERGDFSGIRTAEWNGNTLPAEQFDGVLADVPCSASGRWRRNPDGRWTVTPERVRELCTIQSGILGKICEAVKPGGVLVYATCSLFECENESIVRAFLEKYPEFELEPFPSPLTGKMTDGMLRVFPGDADSDASFAARMRRSTIKSKG